MIQHSPHSPIAQDTRNVLSDLWSNKPVFITVLAALGLLIYIYIKRGQSSSTATTTGTGSGVTSDYSGWLTGNNPVSPVQPSPITPIAPIVPTQAPPSVTTPPAQLPPITVGSPVLGPVGGGVPIGSPITQPVNPNYPLIPYGKLPGGTSYTLGSTLNWGGQIYTIGPGGGGRLWGVPGIVSTPVWQATPIAAGQKQLLYAPQSSY